MSRKRTVVDNVIYANFGSRPKQPSRQKRTMSSAVAGRVFAAQLIPDLLAQLIDERRISRGRTYARDGHVTRVELGSGIITGYVRGSQSEPFFVQLRLPPCDAASVTDVMERLRALPNGLQDVLAGQVPSAWIRTLIAHGADQIDVRCSCPDRALVCKHAIALGEVVAERIHEKPEQVFWLRGVDVRRLLAPLETSAPWEASEVSYDAEHFWQGWQLPELPEPDAALGFTAEHAQVLYRAVEAISSSTVEQLRGVADIEDMYDYLTQK
ncbi:hypothetical protein [Corynebacterium sp.]|uniref:SWIM zinc finger family protein n=1 Tax=Corynebacterium sp. TaxID=1720 RepID=UPI0026DC3C38|nr:hypothetical protein [Corynebacterium sp.]MDO5076548.1 hypothetical protein [Corynebacterium sp.]